MTRLLSKIRQLRERVEKSKSCKYNKYPELPSTKTALFMDRKRQPKAVLSRSRELNYVKAVR